jgi:hypothetical protein
MSRYDRNRYFEDLCVLRFRYDTLGDEDRQSVISIDDAVIYAEAVLAALSADDDAAIDGAPAMPSSVADRD